MPSDKGKFIDLHVLLTPEEHSNLMDNAEYEGLNRSQFVRQKLRPWIKPRPSLAISRARSRGKNEVG